MPFKSAGFIDEPADITKSSFFWVEVVVDIVLCRRRAELSAGVRLAI